ncbi:MAG TPA: SAM-dependent methyltransferase [Catenuloplanes sp.]|jgi:trans-aconitate methyltransferase
MPDGERWAPADVDMGRPNPARVYDWLLGGGHNFQADREMGERLLALQPDARSWAHANRAFLRRAVEHVLDSGVRQILDIGAGIPTLGAVHEIAQKRAPDARVVYVDTDPVAVLQAQHLLWDNPQATAVQGDLRRVDDILEHRDVRAAVDFAQPVAVLLVAVLHFVADADQPAAILARLRQAVAPGSVLVISHASVPRDMTAVQVRAAREYSQQVAPLALRPRAQVQALFDGWRLVEPGVCGVAFWHPGYAEPADGVDLHEAATIPGWAGVAVKPDDSRGEHPNGEHHLRRYAVPAQGRSANAGRARDLQRDRAVHAVR